LALALFGGYWLFKTYDPIDLAKLLLILQTRGLEGLSLLAGRMGHGVGPGGGSISMRVTQYVYRARYNEGWFDHIFGIGAFYGYVENEFLHVILIWGGLGLIAFCATLVESFSASLSVNREAMIYWVAIWIIAGMVLITTYLFSLFVPFAILLGAASAYPLGIVASRQNRLPQGSIEP
jgi:hypothetical protein